MQTINKDDVEKINQLFDIIDNDKSDFIEKEEFMTFMLADQFISL